MALPDGIDREKPLETALALLHLIIHNDGCGVRAWKSLDWDLLDALHDRGWLADPKSKAKSFALTAEDERLAAEFFEKHFGRPSKPFRSGRKRSSHDRARPQHTCQFRFRLRPKSDPVGGGASTFHPLSKYCPQSF